MTEKNISRFLKVCAKAISRTDSTMSYDRTVVAITRLANLVHSTETDENTWYLEEYDIDLGSLIVGAYWFFSDYHAGQSSPEYAALSALSEVYSPGYSAHPEPESAEEDVYEYLETLKG